MEQVIILFDTDTSSPDYGNIVVSITNTGAIVSGATSMDATIVISRPLLSPVTLSLTDVLAGETGVVSTPIPLDDLGMFLKGSYAVNVSITETDGVGSDDGSASGDYFFCPDETQPLLDIAPSVNCGAAQVRFQDITDYGAWVLQLRTLSVQPPIIPPSIVAPLAVSTTMPTLTLTMTHYNVTYNATLACVVYTSLIKTDLEFRHSIFIDKAESKFVNCDLYGCKWSTCYAKFIKKFFTQVKRSGDAASTQMYQDYIVLLGLVSSFQQLKSCDKHEEAELMSVEIEKILDCNCGCSSETMPTAITVLPTITNNAVEEILPLGISIPESNRFVIIINYGQTIVGTPNLSAFSILGSSNVLLSAVISPNILTLTFEDEFLATDNILLSYVPTLPFLTDAAGTTLAEFTNTPVSNLIPVVPYPAYLLSAHIEESEPQDIYLVFDRQLDVNETFVPAAFTIGYTGPTSGSVTANSFYLYVNPYTLRIRANSGFDFLPTHSLVVSYNSGAGSLTDLGLNVDVPSFTNRVVSNQIGPKLLTAVTLGSGGSYTMRLTFTNVLNQTIPIGSTPFGVTAVLLGTTTGAVPTAAYGPATNQITLTFSMSLTPSHAVSVYFSQSMVPAERIRDTLGKLLRSAPNTLTLNQTT